MSRQIKGFRILFLIGFGTFFVYEMTFIEGDLYEGSYFTGNS